MKTRNSMTKVWAWALLSTKAFFLQIISLNYDKRMEKDEKKKKYLEYDPKKVPEKVKEKWVFSFRYYIRFFPDKLS